MQPILDSIVSMLGQIFNALILVRVLLSWVGHNQFNPLIVQLYKLTDPLLKPFQQLIPPEKLGLDISPIFAIMAINAVEGFLKYFIWHIL